MRPTEYEKLFQLMVWGEDADYDALLANPNAIIEYVKKKTNRVDLKFGEIRGLTEWRPNIRMANKFGDGRVFIVGGAKDALCNANAIS